jgi:hypothetical protein
MASSSLGSCWAACPASRRRTVTRTTPAKRGSSAIVAGSRGGAIVAPRVIRSWKRAGAVRARFVEAATLWWAIYVFPLRAIPTQRRCALLASVTRCVPLGPAVWTPCAWKVRKVVSALTNRAEQLVPPPPSPSLVCATASTPPGAPLGLAYRGHLGSMAPVLPVKHIALNYIRCVVLSDSLSFTV